MRAGTDDLGPVTLNVGSVADNVGQARRLSLSESRPERAIVSRQCCDDFGPLQLTANEHVAWRDSGFVHNR